MKDIIIAVILAVLIVITIMHDISIYRLGRKVDILQTFIDTALRQLQGYVLKKMSNADQRIQDVESVGAMQTETHDLRTDIHECVSDTPQTEKIKTPDYCDICNHNGCDNCIANNLDEYCVPSGYAPKDTPQTDCGWK